MIFFQYGNKIVSKGGKESYRPILPQYRDFFKELIQDKQPTEKVFDFRKYHCQLAVEHYVSKGWEREKAEQYVIQRHLSHSAERQDLKKIYLDS